MTLNYEQFKHLYQELNPNIKRKSNKELAVRYKVTESVIKGWRERLKQENLTVTPYEEELEEFDLAKDFPKGIDFTEIPNGYEPSSWNIKEGKISQVWVKKKEDNAENLIKDLDWNTLAKEVSKGVKSVVLPKSTKQGSTKLFCISDIHAGMDTLGWSIEEMNRRFLKILEFTEDCEEVIIISLGDTIDGLDKFTVSRTHRLPQNQNNQEQILNVVKAFQLLFDGLALQIKKGKLGTFSFNSVYESNHSGDMDYVIAKFLEMWLKAKYPQVDCEITSSVDYLLDSFIINDKYHIWFTHGKSTTQKFPLPIQLNDKAELLLINAINTSGAKLSPKTTYVISGDAHTSSFTQGKFFKYYKAPAISPPSTWVKHNYIDSVAGVLYFEFFDNHVKTGTIEF